MSRICQSCDHDCKLQTTLYFDSVNPKLRAFIKPKSEPSNEEARVLMGIHVGILIAPHIKSIAHAKLKQKGCTDVTSTIGSWGIGLAALVSTIAILSKLK